MCESMMMRIIMESNKSPWAPGPKVTRKEFRQHLAERTKLRQAEAKIDSYYLGLDDDVLEYLTSILDGANTQ